MKKINKIIVKMVDGVIDEWTDNYSRAFFSNDDSAFLVCKPDNESQMMAWYNTDYLMSIVIKEQECEG